MENLDKLLVFTMNHPEKCRKKHMGGLPFNSYLQEEITEYGSGVIASKIEAINMA